MTGKIDVYLEIGKTKVFAGAIDWPGWCRIGKDETSALEALVQYAPRYKRALGPAGRTFKPPNSLSELRVVEKVKGNSTTDFGAPDKAASSDERPIDTRELERLKTLLKACWSAFDSAAKKASSKTLSTGPRGGGRDVAKMRTHVTEGQWGYLSRLGGEYTSSRASVEVQSKQIRALFLDALSARARGELPDAGPKGGRRWGPRFAVRRSAWHALDHAWEIEDRVED